MVHRQDVHGKHTGRTQRQKITAVHGKSSPDTEKIESDDSEGNRNPDQRRTLLVQEQPEDRHKNNVQGSDEPALSCGCVFEACLLKAAGKKEKNAACDPADPEIPGP